MSIIWKCLLLFLLSFVSLSNGQIKCLKCNSKDDPLCSMNPALVANTESCEKGCVTLIDVYGNTVRRCSLDSDDCTKSNCEKCPTYECNSDIFPSNRPKCYQCSGSSCIFVSPYAEPMPCKKFVEGDPCFTHVLEEKNATRGCVSDENRECTEAKDLCKICKDGDGCNNQMGLNTVHCFGCDSSINRECQRPQSVTQNCEIDNAVSQCSYQALLGRDGYCYTTVLDNSIVRSCKPIFGYTGTNCTGDLCNSRCFDDINCIQCNQNDKNCDKETGLEPFYKPCPAYTPKCYRCENIDGTETVRGCGFILDTDLHIVCTTCTENGGCNAEKPPRKCYKCDSQTNPLCSSLTSQSRTMTAEFCNQRDDYCITMLNTDGYIERGCMKEIPNADCSHTDTNCIKCDGHMCNIGLLPRNRLYCYQCNGGQEYSCNTYQQQFPNDNACARYVPNDKCYTFAWPNQSMVRGCQSDEDYKREICEKVERNKCAKCDSSSCNKLTYKVSPKLLCYHCDADDDKCPWSSDAPKFCVKQIEFWKKESCFIYKHASGNVTRGCTHDSDLCSFEDDENCMLFDGYLSNNKTIALQSCYVCGNNPGDNENCPESPDKMKPIPCENEIIRYEHRGCFKRVIEGRITRGCRADLTQDHMEQCQNNKVCNMYTCIRDDCNKSSFKQVSLLAVLSILCYWTLSSGYVRIGA